MSFGAALFTQLSGDTQIGALVENDPGIVPEFRIYPSVIPQRSDRSPQMPAITYSLIGIERGVTYCETIPVVARSIAIDCYDRTYDGAEALAEAVRNALLDFRGTLGGLIEVRTANLATELELQDIEPGLYRVSQTWTIWHVE